MIAAMIRAFLAAAALSLATPALAADPGGGVVTAADARAAAAGQAMLRAGGTATDAALAMMLALSVVEPQSSGIGGGGFLVHHDGKSGKADTIDGRETAPAAATPDRFMGADGKPLPYSQAVPGGKSVGVPGNIRLAALAHDKWGKLPWARLFQPAIRLAEDGYRVTPRMARFLAQMAPRWDDFPEISALYAPGGKPLAEGALVRNPALAATLRRIAAEGPEAFYSGPIAASITRAVATAPRNPQPLTAADLAGYKAKERAPVCGAYRAYRICGMGPPSSGAIVILQMLGMLERFDLKALGPDSPVAWHLIAEAMQLAYADRDAYLGDTDFVSAPLAGLLEPAYVAGRSALISPDRSLGRYAPGNPPGAAPRVAAGVIDEHGTTHFAAVDARGDAVTMTSTVESFFGSSLLAGGMVLNNELTDFSFAPEKNGAPVANRVEAGKRPLSSMAPTLVYAPDGRLVLAAGSAGGRRIIMHVFKTLVGTIDWGLPADKAVALPEMFFNAGGLLVEQGTPLAAQIPALARYGQPVTAADIPSKLNVIERTAAGWHGAADPRSEGVVLVQ